MPGSLDDMTTPSRSAAAPGELTTTCATLPPSANDCHGNPASVSEDSPLGSRREKPIGRTWRFAVNAGAACARFCICPCSSLDGEGRLIAYFGASAGAMNVVTVCAFAAASPRFAAGGTATICAHTHDANKPNATPVIQPLCIPTPTCADELAPTDFHAWRARLRPHATAVCVHCSRDDDARGYSVAARRQITRPQRGNRAA